MQEKDTRKKNKSDNISKIYYSNSNKKIDLPLYQSRIAAGFPSPADNYIESNLDLNEFLINHPSATFFVRVVGDSMIKAGIETGDILIVDRSLEPSDYKIVVAVVDGEFTVKRLIIKDGKYYLHAENDDYTDIEIKEEMHFEVWGVVTRIIKEVV